MTRFARKGNKKGVLPATPWRVLSSKKNGYSALKNQESSELSEAIQSLTQPVDLDITAHSPSTQKVRKVRKSDLKVTRKSKLTGNSAKRLLKKFKQKLIGRKLKKVLTKTDTISLLSASSEGDGEHNSKTGVREKKVKKSKRKSSGSRKSVSFGEDTVYLINEDGSVADATREESFIYDEEEEKEPLIHSPAVGTSCFRVKEKLKKKGSKGKNEWTMSYEDEKRKKKIDARKLRRQKRKVCFNCREPGHLVHECPQPAQSANYSEAATSGICFKCGSGTHTSKNCKVKTAEDEYPYAKCFICGEVGHLSRSCPDNPKGLYPYGGCCKICGSVEHLRSNCPEKLKKDTCSEGWGSSSLVISKKHSSVDAEDYSSAPQRKKNGSRKHLQSKIVKF